MCWGCWRKMGSPKLDSPAIQLAAVLIEALYEVNSVAGRLHIVVDDWNLSRRCLRGARQRVRKEPADSEYQGALEETILHLLESMSWRERGSALALAEGYLGPEERW